MVAESFTAMLNSHPKVAAESFTTMFDQFQSANVLTVLISFCLDIIGKYDE